MYKYYENVSLNKTGDRKYEIITKDLELNPKTYKLFIIDGIIVLKPESQYKDSKYKQDDKFEPEETSFVKNEPKPAITSKYNTGYNNYTNTKYNSDKEYKEPEILKTGFYVCEDTEEARGISRTLYGQINDGKVLGMKGFDGKYYIFKKEYYIKLKSLITGVTKTNKNTTTLANLVESTKEPEDAIKGAIEIMKEEGSIFEKSRGNYNLI